jgi:hypothetical protein
MRARPIAVALWLAGVVALASCGEPRRWTPRHATGEPVPSASTSAAPLWLRNRE